MKYADIVDAQRREVRIRFLSHTRLHDGSCLTFKTRPMKWMTMIGLSPTAKDFPSGEPVTVDAYMVIFRQGQT